MKCPRCGYTSFDHLQSCKKCGRDFCATGNRNRIQDFLDRLPFLRKRSVPAVADPREPAPAESDTENTWAQSLDTDPFSLGAFSIPASEPAPDPPEPALAAEVERHPISAPPEPPSHQGQDTEIDFLAEIFTETEVSEISPEEEILPPSPLHFYDIHELDEESPAEESPAEEAPVEEAPVEEAPMAVAASALPSDYESAQQHLPNFATAERTEEFKLFSPDGPLSQESLPQLQPPRALEITPFRALLVLPLPWARFAAGVVDVLLLALVFLLFLAVGEMVRIPGDGILPGVETLIELAVPYFLMLFILFFSYFTLLHHIAGQTPGKMLFGLRVEARDGEPLTLEQAFLRSAGGLISLSLLGIGYIFILLDREGRGWNDQFAGSRVVRISEASAAQS